MLLWRVIIGMALVNFLVLAFAAQAAVSQGSLGIGLDVLPVAYTFAANQLDFAPDLRLTSCDRTSCRWAVGHGVEVSAYVTGWDLGIRGIEVSATGDDKAWFEKSCLTLVALTLSGAPRPDVRSIADMISHTPDRANASSEKEVDGIRFYGTAHGATGDKVSCGAAIR